MNKSATESQITITATMDSTWIPVFISMLKRMEQLGCLGVSKEVGIYSDGDGNFRPKFSIEGFEEFDPVPPTIDHGGNVMYDVE